MFWNAFKSTLGPIGIDYGASGVKFVQLRGRGDNVTASAAGHVDYDPQDPSGAPLGSAIQAQLNSSGASGKRCVVSLARTDLSVHAVRMPSLPDSEMKQAVLWEAAERFGLDREAIEVDYIRMGEVERANESREEILLIAAERDRIHARIEPLLAIGLRPMAIDVSVAALVRTHSMGYRRRDDQQHVRAVLEVGSTGSTFIVMRGDQVALCKPIEIGGRDFDASVAEHLGIELSVAHQMRAQRISRRIGPVATEPSSETDQTDRAIFEATRALMDHLCKEVGLCLRYYGVTFRSTPPNTLVLSGGDGLEPQLDEMLGRACKLPVLIDDPASSVDQLYQEIRALVQDRPIPPQAWAVAVGLSLRESLARGVRKKHAMEAPRHQAGAAA